MLRGHLQKAERFLFLAERERGLSERPEFQVRRWVSSLRGTFLEWKPPAGGSSPRRDEIRLPLTHVCSVPHTGRCRGLATWVWGQPNVNSSRKRDPVGHVLLFPRIFQHPLCLPVYVRRHNLLQLHLRAQRLCLVLSGREIPGQVALLHGQW